MGTCYVNICVAFKAVVMAFPMLGGLFQVYRWIITNLNGIGFFYYHCEVLCSSWFLKELFELIKLILWRSNNQTYHLDS
jgi:hypothetical protein